MTERRTLPQASPSEMATISQGERWPGWWWGAPKYDRCTCQFGRDTDGSEFGACVYCEERAWQEDNGMTDEDLEAMIQDGES